MTSGKQKKQLLMSLKCNWSNQLANSMAKRRFFEVKFGWTRCDLVAVVGSHAMIVSVGFFTNRVQRYLDSIEVMCAGVKSSSI